MGFATAQMSKILAFLYKKDNKAVCGFQLCGVFSTSLPSHITVVSLRARTPQMCAFHFAMTIQVQMSAAHSYDREK